MRRQCLAGSCSEADLTCQASIRDYRPQRARSYDGYVRERAFRTTTATRWGSSLLASSIPYIGLRVRSSQTSASVRGRGVLPSMSVNPYALARLAGNHRRRGKLACLVVRTNAGAEHRVPTPERLFPEWLGPGENAILNHPLVATPHAVHQDVNRVGLVDDPVERRFHLAVDSMVAADACNLLLETLVIRR